MSIDTTHTIDEDVKAVNEAFLAGRPIPPDVGARIEERAAEIRERLSRQPSTFNSTEAIRQDRETGH